MTLTTETWKNKAIEVHGNRYDYSRSEYAGGNELIEIICKDHGSFFILATSHINKRVRGCIKCSKPSSLVSEDMKLCTKCGIVKNFLEFYKGNKIGGTSCYCKECNNKKTKEWMHENREYMKEQKKEWRIKNIDSVKIYDKKYRTSVKGKERSRIRHINTPKKYNYVPKQKILIKECIKCGTTFSVLDIGNKKLCNSCKLISKQNLRVNNVKLQQYRYENDPKFKMKFLLRKRLLQAYNRIGVNEKLKPSREYGIDYTAIFEKIGPKPEGNFHLDHIIPISVFNLGNSLHVRLAHHPENIRWLDGIENMSKSNYVDLNLISSNPILVDIAKQIGLI